MTLYTGVTNDLYRRSNDHKNGVGSEFTARYHFDRLVYYEEYDSPEDVIAREKEIKRWRRQKKNALVEVLNPQWNDLQLEMFGERFSASLATAKANR